VLLAYDAKSTYAHNGSAAERSVLGTYSACGFTIEDNMFPPWILRSVLLGAWLASTWSWQDSVVRPKSEDQQLTAIFGRWTPSSAQLAIEDLRTVPMLTEADRDLLRRAGVTGIVSVTSAGIHGNGAPAKAIVLLRAPLSQPVALLQPRGTAVVYMQSGDGIVTYPPDASFMERKIELRPDRSPSPSVSYAVELVSGARQGGSAVFWRPQ
jgi:hypothetical protein